MTPSEVEPVRKVGLGNEPLRLGGITYGSRHPKEPR